MREPAVPALLAPPRKRDNPLTRSVAGVIGGVVLLVMLVACLGSLPWTLSPAEGEVVARHRAGNLEAVRLPPTWWPYDESEKAQRRIAGVLAAKAEIAAETGVAIEDAPEPSAEHAARLEPRPILGTDELGRSLFVRILAGGGISLGIGLAAAAISVIIGTAYGMIAGWYGGRVDSLMMRIVDILYGIPYILLVVLLAVAVDAIADNALRERFLQREAQRDAWIEAQVAQLPPEQQEEAAALEAIQAEAATRYGVREGLQAQQSAINIVTLLVAIGGVSWLTMARVIRGQVLSLKAQPFVEAARAIGAPTRRIFLKHLLPNLLGPVIVYATLTVPQAILQESFLSFLGIGVMPPMPSWGNLAAAGLSELNPVHSRWWLLVFPCALLGVTLLALNFVGEGLREALDPKRAR